MSRYAATVTAFVLLGLGQATAEDAEAPWRSDWAVADGLSLARDTTGYQLPTAIAFVPDPGAAPNDPLYFVTELRGTLKVVTNDRTVHVFAKDVTRLAPEEEVPAREGENGMAGLCLDPVRGYIFVTYVYRDRDGILRNGMTRFSAAPGSFSLTPSGQTDFNETFARDVSSSSHQIGPCQVDGDALYVSVGDGENAATSRALDSTLGKILKMTLDGGAYPGNPLSDGGEASPARYVWAYGLRNPFSLRVVDHRLFVGDNGTGTDRLLEVREGGDYAYDGGDWSIGLNADMVFTPAVSPVGMDFQASADRGLGPGYERAFFLALAGSLSAPGPSAVGAKSVVTYRYDLQGNRIDAVPVRLAEYRGDAIQIVVGVGVGPDGVYFVPMLPDASGAGSIFKMSATGPGPFALVPAASSGPLLVARYGCLSCHRIGLVGSTVAPSLDGQALVVSIERRLGSAAFRDAIAGLRADDRAAIEKILSLDNAARVRAWMIKHIQSPAFDNPNAQMPDLGVDEAAATLITDYLLAGAAFETWQRVMLRADNVVRSQRTGIAVGLFGGVALTLAVFFLARRLRRPAAGAPPDGAA